MKFNAGASTDFATVGFGVCVHYCDKCIYLQVDVLCFALTVGWFTEPD